MSTIDLTQVAIADLPRSEREIAELAGLAWPLSSSDAEKFSQTKLIISGATYQELKRNGFTDFSTATGANAP